MLVFGLTAIPTGPRSTTYFSGIDEYTPALPTTGDSSGDCCAAI